jgi:hypothetical protein
MRTTELKPVYSDFLPPVEKMEEGVLYISKVFGVAKHLCACGCKSDTVTPFKHQGETMELPGWDFIENNGLVTLDPSIGNAQFPCQSHYRITNNKIIWY